MLSREHAQERLKEFQVDGWKTQRLTAVRGLRGSLVDAGEALLGQGRAAKAKDWREQQAVFDAAARALDAATPHKRQQLFAALFPSLSPYVEAAWRLLHTLPYQGGWVRKAFRAPGDAAASRAKRFAWLRMLVRAVEGYDQDVAWFAAWAPYLPYGAPDTLGLLFAATLNAGGSTGDDVFRILCASASGQHEIGGMGRHVTRALLAASRPDAWEFVERLLLAAQRQEGLRQVVLETADEAHPAAFRRMLRLILDHDLARFSATIRAMDVWFGLSWELTTTRVVNDAIATVLRLLEDDTARCDALVDQDGSAAYLALWALAFEDAPAAVLTAQAMLGDPVVERRFVAAHLLAQLDLPQARRVLRPALDDPDLRVAIRASWDVTAGDDSQSSGDIFERLERLMGRLGKDRRLPPIAWPWMSLSISQASMARTLVRSLGSRSPMRLLPFLKVMDPYGRSEVVNLLAARKPRDVETRDALLGLVGDPSGWVRQKALKALEGDTMAADEAARLEGLLTRKAGDLRRGTLGLLLNQPDEAALASAERLLAATHPLQRLGGLELLGEMQAAERRWQKCRALAEAYRSGRSNPTDAESAALDTLLGVTRSVPTLDDALGLLDASQRTPPTPPTTRRRLLLLRDKPRLVTDAAVACLKSLDALVEAHRTTAVTVSWGHGVREELIGNMSWSFPQPDSAKTAEDDLARLPLRDVWEKWERERPAELRDADGMETLRALAPFFASNHYPYHAFADDGPHWLLDAVSALFGRDPAARLRYPAIVQKVLQWLLRRQCRAGGVDFLLDAVEYSLTLVPNHAWTDDGGLQHFAGIGTRGAHVLGWLQLARYQRGLWPRTWESGHHVRLWGLLRFIDEPTPEAPRRRPLLDEVLAAYDAGAATEADVLDQLLGPREASGYGGRAFAELSQLTARRATDLNLSPGLPELVDRCRRRIVEVELARGDLPTAASAPALALRSIYGVDTVVRLLKALGGDTLVRGWTQDSLSKAAVFSHLLRVSYPAATDSVEDFAQAAKIADIPERRLVELALYAPQWAAHVEHALDWPGLTEAAWWLHAHTKDNLWRVDSELRDHWAAQVAERTPLTAQSLVDGAVDVAWFRRVYEQLGAARWDEVYRAAQYTSGGNGHTRARLFADAMLGRCDEGALVKRITQKRHQDSVRALGLLPLSAGEDRARDLLDRYRVVQEFLRTSQQFGAQRRANEKLAASIALENLARTAGYPDPQRLAWAMEREAVADLATGPIVARVEPVTVSLSITRWGEPEVTVDKAGKALKNIPATAKKDAAVTELLGRQRDIKRQATRMRQSLETAMVRGDEFSGVELRDLMKHPVLAPMLRGLVLVGDGLMGYPVVDGVALEGYAGRAAPIGNAERLRIAHPLDLLASGDWHRWQHECFVRERIQPFKQVFRELYVLTGAERMDATASYRYEGQQVQPQQAMALLGQRGWVNHPDEGIRRTFHDCGLSAWLGFQHAPFTPVDVAGVTVESVWFSRRGDWTPIPLAEAPPRVFSEVMRDVDLVVSVAHLGGVDPETTASTLEMRAGLVRETCAMLGLGNVRVERAHALITGALGEYSIHLGSGVVHRMPGGAVCIVPVHSQHRGRLFLPFADDDPKTAEVVSKVLLLARDGEIRDPTILEQIV